MNAKPLTIEAKYLPMYLALCADLVLAMDACYAEQKKASRAASNMRTTAGAARAEARRDAFWTAYWECSTNLRDKVESVRDRGGLLHLHQPAATALARELERQRMASDLAHQRASR